VATVVELISGLLKREGVQYLFGIPGGGGTIDLLDATERDGIRFVLNSHETASAVMACVVAELTGVPGVVLTAISPGVANVANGVAYAYLERVPLLVLSDSYPSGREPNNTPPNAEPPAALPRHYQVDGSAYGGVGSRDAAAGFSHHARGPAPSSWISLTMSPSNRWRKNRCTRLPSRF